MEKDRLSKEVIERRLGEKHIPFILEIEEKVDSTNNVLKACAASGEERDRVLIAEEQSAGRGRRGRSFFSPRGTGLYMSILLHPHAGIEECTMLTTLTAAALVKAIEAAALVKAEIKWVNDIFVRGKKAAGILTEAIPSGKGERPAYVVVGVGINLYEPQGGFPRELSDVAGAVLDTALQRENLRNFLAAEFLINFQEYYQAFPAKVYMEEYRKNCFVIGQRVRILEPEGAGERMAQREAEKRVYARVLGVDDNCYLQVQYDDQTVELLSGGEISIRL